jgi:hypothetical protein
MNQRLIAREYGFEHPCVFAREYTSMLLYAMHPAPRVLFDGAGGGSGDGVKKAHGAGVNSIAVEKFEERL